MHESRVRLLRLLFTLTVLSFATLAAFADVPISEPVIARGAGAQGNPASATDGRDFLLVWSDERSGTSAIYATRVAADGTVLDPEGILVSDDAGGSASSPAVAWTGSSYIVVWSSGACRYRRITSDGRLVGSSDMAIGAPCLGLRLASSGSTAILAATGPSWSIEVVAIENTWPAVRPLGKLPSGSAGVACSDSECVLAWQYGHDIMARRIGPRGERFVSSDTLLASNAMRPAIACASGRLLLIWRDWFEWDASSSRFRMQQFDVRGNAGIEPQTPPVPVAKSDKTAVLEAAVSSSGRGFLVAWSQSREAPPVDRRPALRVEEARTLPIEMHARRIGDGELEEELILAYSSVGSGPLAAASNGATHLGAWITEGSDKIAAGLAREGALASRIAVTRTATLQTDPQVVNCGDHLLVVWAEEVRGDGRFSILARRFRFSGEALDPGPIVIANSTESQRNPAAAFDGRSYLIAWIEENRGVRARGLRRDGTPSPEIFTLSGESPFLSRPAVDATDRGFAVLHEDTDGTRMPLVLTRIGPGSPIERTVITPLWHSGSALGWNGTELVALWSNDQRVYAARVTSDGVRLDPEAILVGYGQWLGSPSVACDATECIAAWSEFHLGVQAASIIGPTALFISESIRDLGDYSSPPAGRYSPKPVRTDGGFKLISSGPGGTLYMRSVLDDSLSAETQLTDRRIDGDTYSLADTPNGTVLVDSRPVFGPGYAGARRLFLRFLSQ